ncbi:MAG: acyltransferase [Rhodanobacteraceae bacterium]
MNAVAGARPSVPGSLPRVGEKEKARNQGIDLLRGLSILLVILNHIGLRVPLAHTALGAYLPHRLLQSLNYEGYEAVFVFFVISGFLITNHSLRRWNGLERIDFGAFYARRFARIVPCLLVLVFVLSALDLLGVQDYVIKHADQSLPRAIAAALGLHLNWYEGHTGYLPGGWDVLWSLSIEEMFYIGFPVVCFLIRREWVLAPLLILFALSLPATHAALAGNEIWQEKAYLPGMAAIAMGVLGALIAARFAPPRRWITTAPCIAGALGLAAVLLASNILWPVLHDGYMLLLTFSAMCLVVGLHWRETKGWRTKGWRRPLPGFGWLCSFGRLSYEIYLTHMFVVYAAVRAFKATGGNIGLGYLWYLPVMIVCWLLGVLVARFFSIPCDRALRGRLLEPESWQVAGEPAVAKEQS